MNVEAPVSPLPKPSGHQLLGQFEGIVVHIGHLAHLPERHKAVRQVAGAIAHATHPKPCGHRTRDYQLGMVAHLIVDFHPTH